MKAAQATSPWPRSSEWVLVCYFTYVAIIATHFPLDNNVPKLTALLALGVFAIVFTLAFLESRVGAAIGIARDWIPLALTLVAYREMDWFTPKNQDHHLENGWVVWDRIILDQLGTRHIIESLGTLLPSLFELFYLFVYAAGPCAVAVLYINNKRYLVNRVLFCYLLGTLSAYAMFPFFPSEPPRTVFPNADLPGVATVFRSWNLSVLRGYGIHSSVFPSAHVSSVFSAAFGLLLFLPRKKWLGAGFLFYAVSVAVATVYGRYHYAVDALAGFALSLVSLFVSLTIIRKQPIGS